MKTIKDSFTSRIQIYKKVSKHIKRKMERKNE